MRGHVQKLQVLKWMNHLIRCSACKSVLNTDSTSTAEFGWGPMEQGLGHGILVGGPWVSMKEDLS